MIGERMDNRPGAQSERGDATMLLKVGELAKHSGLTVRALHHYDAIGLLKPSHRSDSGYRLYSRDDVARLHGIQTLRHMGLALDEIGCMLSGRGGQPVQVIERQLHTLDQEIAKATELRSRLTLMREHLQKGDEPDMRDWLATLSLMTTYTRYFSAAELRLIFRNYKPLEGDWLPLIADVRAAMSHGLPPDSPEVQPLASRWMSLMHQWMEGDFDLMERWGHMYRQEPSAQGRNKAPEGDMIEFISQATALRMALLSKYLTVDEMRRLGRIRHAEWLDLQAQAAQLMRDAVPAGAPASLRAVAQWQALLDRLAGHDPALRAKLLAALDQEPLLRAGGALSEPVRAYLRLCHSKTLDPDLA